MSQHYLNPKDEKDPGRLPGVETFEVTSQDWSGRCPICSADDDVETRDFVYGSVDFMERHKAKHLGWYWWSCFPGCLPDSDPFGPFETEAEALEDARQGIEDEDEAESGE